MAERPKYLQFKNVQLLKDQSLGIGSYGAVCKAKCDDLLCAAKIIHPTLFDPNELQQIAPQRAHRLPIRRFEQECEFMSAIRHPNIVQYLGMFRDTDTHLPVLLMELMDDSLTHFLASSTQPIPYHIQVNICHDITLALAFLHSNNIVHRDLSSNNVLLRGTLLAKVTDFGMARLGDINPQVTRFTNTMCPGTDVYMPPEAVQEKPIYTEKIDCFSFGVITVQILTRLFPKPRDRLERVELSHPRLRTGSVLQEVPEIDRRQNHINQVDPSHSLLPIALDSLKDKDSERPSAHQLCMRIADLKGMPKYIDSVRAVEDKDEVIRSLRVHMEEKDHIISTSEEENQQLRQLIQEKMQTNRQLEEKERLFNERLSNLQQKCDQTLRERTRQLQEKKRQFAQVNQQLEASELVVAQFERRISELEHTIKEKEQQLRQWLQQDQNRTKRLYVLEERQTQRLPNQQPRQLSHENEGQLEREQQESAKAVTLSKASSIKPVVGQNLQPEDKTLSKFKIIEQKNCMKICQPIPTMELYRENGIRFCEFGISHDNFKDTQKVVLVVGATGAGKTTLINTMTNYLFGVKWGSDFRYKLVVEEGFGDQSLSQTQEITAYTFHPSCSSLGYSITIIDTPGFGDTRRQGMDKKITDKVRGLFAITGSCAIDYIHAVVFVVQASLARLTEAQEYNFNSVLELFGKDAKKNIFIAATFCDNKKDIKVLAALTASSVPFQTVLPFNNSGLYYASDPNDDDSDDDDDEVEKMRLDWKMGEKTFKAFLKILSSSMSVSASLTNHVLNERQELELIMQRFPDHIKKLIAKIDEIEKDKKALKEINLKVKENKEFTYTVTVTKVRRVKVTDGRWVTTCKNCNYTCDNHCLCSPNWKYFCHAISGITGKCKYCPNHCSYKDHEDNGHIYEQYQEEEERTEEDIKNKYFSALADEGEKSKQVNIMEEELKKFDKQAIQCIRQALHCVQKLDEIAHRPKTYVSAHIKNLVEQETRERKIGWERRIQYFESLPQNQDAMAELEKQDESWFKKLINNISIHWKSTQK